MPLAADDVGVKALTQMQAKAAATGTITFVVAHPIAVNACPIANIACLMICLVYRANLTSISDSACLPSLNRRRDDRNDLCRVLRGERINGEQQHHQGHNHQGQNHRPCGPAGGLGSLYRQSAQ